jgi:DNA-binding MarR family transcriptional regulator
MAERNSEVNGAEQDFIANLARRYSDRYPWIDTLATEFFLRFVSVTNARAAATARFFRANGMERTEGRYAALRVLFFAQDKHMALSDISSDMDVSAANITVLVDGLEKDGLVVRVPHPTDKRSTLVQLTSKGEQLASVLVPGMADLNTELLAGFSEDEKLMLIEAMKRLKANAAASFTGELADL